MTAPEVLDARRLPGLLPLPELIAAVGAALEGPSVAPPRTSLTDPGGWWGVMPAPDGEGGLVCKLVRQRSGGDGPTISGTLVVLDGDGRLLLVADAGPITALRTAAAAAVATDRLAAPDASVLAIVGAGALAGPHARAIAHVRELREIRIAGRTPSRARALAEELRAQGLPVVAVASAGEAIAGADVVTTVTTSATPVLDDVRDGAHVNAMGAHGAGVRELPGALVGRAAVVVVDAPATAGTEAGDVIIARQEGLLDPRRVTSLGDPEGIAELRAERPGAPTVFCSVGRAELDLAAVAVLRRSLR
jgi:ornithine cyclodeaminase/alanine dehydrogenase-like protein (mu-crystallin family)